MTQENFFDYDFSRAGDIFDRCDILKKLLFNTEEQNECYELIENIIGWYKGLKKDWIPQLTPKQKDVVAKKYKDFELIAESKKRYFSRKAGRSRFSDDEITSFKSGCIEHIPECETFVEWCYWFDEKLRNMFGEEWLMGKNSSIAVKCYSVCFAHAKKHFKVYEFAPRPEVSLTEFQTYFPQWMKDARQFKPKDNQAQYDYFVSRAVEKLQETFGRNFTSYDKDYYKSASQALELARYTGANEFLPDSTVELMFPKVENHFDTYEDCKADFVDLVCRVCTDNKVDTTDRLDKLIRFFLKCQRYRYYSENETYIQYASDLYETAYAEGQKIIESFTCSIPF